MSISKKSSTFAGAIKESCLSGRKSRTRNAVYAQAYRGFESPTFRLNTKIEALTTSIFLYITPPIVVYSALNQHVIAILN